MTNTCKHERKRAHDGGKRKHLCIAKLADYPFIYRANDEVQGNANRSNP